ncbi:Retinol dehydrogenase 7 [Larimichthys crocea]|uniref:Uncharacterized protein n=1 Tax=Larimichthys crocea TaxID=215358 RepID=A0ACD3QGT5_LARCR|nr:Retinol dehydrogenase 7 [Larimichthys crocea]
MFMYVFVPVAVCFIYRWYKERKRVPNKGNKYVYITGCDSGFGNVLAKHLDQLGFCVIASCYTENGEDELKKNASGRLTTIHLDVTDSESVRKAAAVHQMMQSACEYSDSQLIVFIVSSSGLWAVVNNAGVSVPSGPTDWLTIDDFKSMISVNLYGVIDVTLSVLPLIKMTKGRVVNVASVFGRISPFGGPYCVSNLNMAPFGVKVACIEPGFFKTNVTDTALVKDNIRNLWDKLPQDIKDDYGKGFLASSLDKLDSRFRQLTDSDLMKVALSHMVLTCTLLLAAHAAIHWYIRDSYKVDAFNKKHVFITGCDSGFGNLLARQLGWERFPCHSCMSHRERLKTLLLNVTDSSSIRRAVEFVSKEVGERGLWGLVNNAGRSTPIGPPEWMQFEDFAKVLDVNLIGVIDVTLQFLPLLKKAQGRVVNVASILGRLTLTGGGYCPSKYGVEAFSDSLRRDMQHFGINVSIIEPGFFKTGRYPDRSH